MRKKKKVNTCQHKEGWTFEKTNLGVKRTCKNKKCGFSVTEIPHGLSNSIISPIKKYKRKSDEEVISEIPEVAI